MSILIDEKTPILVQGITGDKGTFHAKEMLDYGTNVVAGVTPGKGGGEHLGADGAGDLAHAGEVDDAGVGGGAALGDVGMVVVGVYMYIALSFWLSHQAGTNFIILYPVTRTADIQVNFIIAPVLRHFATGGQILRIGAAELQHNWMFFLIKLQMAFGIAMNNGAGGDHFCV